MDFTDDINVATAIIKNADAVKIISHVDADGIASGAIIAQAISRLGIPITPLFVRQLESRTMRYIPNDNTLKIFTDLGAGQQNLMEEAGLSPDNVLILDHHINQPASEGTMYPQVNSQFYGQEYAKCSAAGVSYLVAKELNPTNTDLAELAVVGNIGDMMARETCCLVGIARWIAEDGVKSGHIRIAKGINCYGLSTRPLHLCLANSDDPFLPGISGNPKAAANLMLKLGIYKKSSDQRTWEELHADEVKMLASVVAEQMIANGESTERLFAELYFFPHEIEKTPLRNASEYATMLNACGRWAKPKIGMDICFGNRDQQYHEAEHMLRHHRSIIRELCEHILNTGVVDAGSIQWIHTGDLYPDTIVGIGAGMTLQKFDTTKPIMVLCSVSDEPDLVKISMRTYETMLRRGVDLQAALIVAATEFNGTGGGHNIAAGAYIPKGCENDFIKRVNELIAWQLAAGSPNR
ncbi:MAG: DHH family phosphoesterase [Methanocalculaceae archaeon]|jgi:RecJ-like exonuclease|nr:DHH family phosphoesterase [Methanocalculaceae archaeon]